MKDIVLPPTDVFPDPPAFRQFWDNDVNPLSGSRKRRLINDPNPAMKSLHRRMLRFVRGLPVELPSSTACRKGQSALRNVLLHRKDGQAGFRRYFYLTDISSAYQAVRPEQIARILVWASTVRPLRYDEVLETLSEHFFDRTLGGLATGGPASPDLFNLYCEFLIDRRLRDLCERYGLRYTRYLDDLTFSSLTPIGKKKRQALRNVILAAGFRLSDKKTRVLDLRKGPVSVNGIGICLDGRIFLPRHAHRHLVGLLHRACAHGSVNPSVIHGKMGTLKMLTEPSVANQTELRAFRLYERFRRTERARTGLIQG